MKPETLASVLAFLVANNIGREDPEPKLVCALDLTGRAQGSTGLPYILGFREAFRNIAIA